jgi:hypothetical protein
MILMKTSGVFFEVGSESLNIDISFVSEVGTSIRAIALMMEAVSSSHTSVNFYQTTRRNITEDSHLHTRRRERN